MYVRSCKKLLSGHSNYLCSTFLVVNFETAETNAFFENVWKIIPIFFNFLVFWVNFEIMENYLKLLWFFGFPKWLPPEIACMIAYGQQFVLFLLGDSIPTGNTIQNCTMRRSMQICSDLRTNIDDKIYARKVSQYNNISVYIERRCLLSFVNFISIAFKMYKKIVHTQ